MSIGMHRRSIELKETLELEEICGISIREGLVFLWQ